MKLKIGIVELNRNNAPRDLVKLLGGQRNCFHFRKNSEGGLKKLKPLQAVILNEEGKILSDLPEQYVEHLVAGRLDVGDPVSVSYNNGEPVFYIDVIVPTFRRRPNQ
jgi:hypothetical protein